jgi:hypothetical protein
MSNRTLGRITLVATLLVAVAASAEVDVEADEEGRDEGPVYARTGFYIGAGGTLGWGMGWDNDVDKGLSKAATDAANESATDNLAATNPGATITPLDITVRGADLEDVQVGMNGVIGYRAADSVAFEVEAEWLTDSNKSRINVAGSTERHTVEIEEVWTLTANIRMFPPTDWRIQPSALFGLGIQHSKLSVDLAMPGLTTTDSSGAITVPADFSLENKTKLTGAIRLGGGIDFYATPNIVGQLNATYVLPFDEVGSVVTADYMSFTWRVIYRF